MTWEARAEEEKRLREHLASQPYSATVVYAPKGAGKSTLVNTVLHGRKNVIFIDFTQVDPVPDADFINYILVYLLEKPTLVHG